MTSDNHDQKRKTNIYTIPSHEPFARTLARMILEQQKKSGISGLDDMLVLLPTRRACRALTEAFLELSGGEAMVLPDIQTVGDMDAEEGELFIQPLAQELKMPRSVSSTEQQMLLTTLLAAWIDGPRISYPRKISWAQCARLAVELANFLGDIHRHNIRYEALKALAPQEYSIHWKHILHFLEIVMDVWPTILSERGMVDPVHYQQLAMHALARYLKEIHFYKQIIVAGSTGSLPAVAEIICSVSDIDHGIVVLPGLDQWMKDDAWQDIDQIHPQYGMKLLLQKMGVERDVVQTVSYEENAAHAKRSQLMSLLMLPAKWTMAWQDTPSFSDDMLEDLSYIEAADAQEEAQIVALHLRHALETPDLRAALITHDRMLARKVSTIMARWDIDIDDTAGVALSATQAAVFLRLLIQVMESGETMQSLLALLKHPMAAMGMEPVRFRHLIYQLEKKVLRGIHLTGGCEALAQLLQQRQLDELADIVSKVQVCLQPFVELRHRATVPLMTLLQTQIKVAEELAQTHTLSGTEHLFHGEVGEHMSAWLDDMLVSARTLNAVPPVEYGGLFDVLLAGKVYRPHVGKHPRLSILGPIEARMLPFDYIILGGMNEGVWPEAPQPDPWMSRPMRVQLGLPLPERKVGLSAHDFVQMVCMPRVLITRSQKDQGKLTIPSRWLTKLQVMLAIQGLQDKLQAKTPWRSWLRAMYHVDKIEPLKPPNPTPPVEARPNTLSVTNIELWMRHPYGLYAKKILGLRKLDQVDHMPTQAQFGDMIHSVLDQYTKAYDQLDPDKSAHVAFVLETGRQILQTYVLHPISKQYWWSKLERLASDFVEHEQARRQEGLSVSSEQTGQVMIEAFTLHARADRLESRAGFSSLVDYKTGQLPSKADVELGFSPQMTLEALVAKEGGFEAIHHVNQMQYWKLGGNDSSIEKEDVLTTKYSVEQAVEEARIGLKKLIAAFNDPTTPYLAIPDPDKAPTYDDYAHLARIKEWL